MTRKLINRLSQLFKEKNNNDSSISRKSQDSAYFPETTIKEEEEQQEETSEKQTNKENKASLKREKSLSKRASLWLSGKRKKKNCNKQDMPFRVCTEEQKQQEEEEEVESSAELSGKVEIPFDLVIPISYSSFSMSQPLSSSSSSSAFSYSHLVTKSHSLPSDQETIATVRTSIDRQEKASTSNHHHHHLQQFEYEPRSKKLDLAEKVRSMLGDAISLADQELENES